MSEAKQYLGDSVYVDLREGFRGGLVLTTENGRADDPSNTIVLDTEVYAALVIYVREVGALGGLDI